MASASANLQMTRMDVGVAQKEQIFNSDVDTIDAVLAGDGAISLADANTLLSEAQQCNAMLVFSGTLSATRTIHIRVSTDGEVNARPRFILVFNNTNHDLLFKLATVAGTTPTGFGSGVTVTSGKKALLGQTNPAAGGASGDIYKFAAEV